MLSKNELNEYKNQLKNKVISLERDKVFKLIKEIERLEKEVERWKSLNSQANFKINQLTNPTYKK